MKIIKKDSWGFWIFKRYSVYLENEEESITEMIVDKDTWDRFEVGDYCDSKYEEIDKTTRCWWMRD